MKQKSPICLAEKKQRQNKDATYGKLSVLSFPKEVLEGVDTSGMFPGSQVKIIVIGKVSRVDVKPSGYSMQKTRLDVQAQFLERIETLSMEDDRVRSEIAEDVFRPGEADLNAEELGINPEAAKEKRFLTFETLQVYED